MAKNIVICSDGTGNTAIKDRGTNVFKLYEAVAHTCDTVQLAYYDDGVGTEDMEFLKLLGGAFGFGMARNVRRLYADLCRCYEPGDAIYLFGFSRGAFTVRTLAGLICLCGVIDAGQYATDEKLRHAVHHAYETYRKRYFRLAGLRAWIHAMQTDPVQTKTHARALLQDAIASFVPRAFARPFEDRPATEREADIRKRRIERQRSLRHHLARLTHAKSEKYAQQFRAAHAVHSEARIRFVGVWDTVAAYGFPIAGIADLWNFLVYPYKFSDQTLHGKVDEACQALAIDEQRKTFAPEIWNEDPASDSVAGELAASRISQVWFAGVHSNVGGGYPKQGMSLVTLDWMMSKAEAAGLIFQEAARRFVREHANVDDHLYDSRAGLAVLYRYQPRNIDRLAQCHDMTPRVHVSIIHRIVHATQDYAPGNFPGQDKLRLEATGTVNEAERTRLELLTGALIAHVRENGAPFARGSYWVSRGERDHLMLICLLVGVGFLIFLANGFELIDSLPKEDYWTILVKTFTSRLGVVFTLLVLVAGFTYFWGQRSLEKAQAAFSAYWRSLRPVLAAILLGISPGEGGRGSRGLPRHTEPAAPPQGWHRISALAKVTLWGLIALALATALFLRVLGCSAGDSAPWQVRYFCSFRGLGVALLGFDGVIIVVLTWLSVDYDPQKDLIAPPPSNAPLYPRFKHRMAAGWRALKVRDTPYRNIYRTSLWLIALMGLGFAYLVFLADFAFM